MTALLTRLFIKDYQNTKDPAVRAAYGRMAGMVGIVCNLLLSLSKMLTGWLLSSMAILSDGLNNLSDATSSVVTLVGFKLSGRPADREHPYGHARYEYVSGLVVAFFILLVGAELVRSSFDKILHPEEVFFSIPSMIVLAVSVLVKLWMSVFNHKLGLLVDSATLEATAQDSRNDVFTTSGVLVCVLISRFTGLQLDGYVGLAMAVFILISGVNMIRETMSPILGRAPDRDMVREILQQVRAYPGVLGTHDLMVHDYGPGNCFASVHVEMDASGDILESHDVTDQIERDFQKQGIHLVVHLDPVVTDDEEVNELRRMMTQLLASLKLGLSMHDFRVVKGYTHTNLIFDVVLPYDCTLTEDEVRGMIQRRVEEHDPRLFTVIQVDRSFVG